MSLCHWAIQGYGVRVNDAIVDNIIGKDGIETEFCMGDLREISLDMDEVVYYIDDGNDESYLLYTPTLFGDMTDEEKTLGSSSDVAKLIYKLYKDYLKVDEQWVIDNIDFVSSYGCS